MSIRKILLCTCLMIAASAGPSMARVDLDVNIGAPPPREVEVVPAVPPGYAWAPGYWDWEHGRHVWVPGRRIEDRPGYIWVPEHWEHRGPRWYMERGYWKHREYWHEHPHYRH